MDQKKQLGYVSGSENPGTLLRENHSLQLKWVVWHLVLRGAAVIFSLLHLGLPSQHLRYMTQCKQTDLGDMSSAKSCFLELYCFSLTFHERCIPAGWCCHWIRGFYWWGWRTPAPNNIISIELKAYIHLFKGGLINTPLPPNPSNILLTNMCSTHSAYKQREETQSTFKQNTLHLH